MKRKVFIYIVSIFVLFAGCAHPLASSTANPVSGSPIYTYGKTVSPSPSPVGKSPSPSEGFPNTSNLPPNNAYLTVHFLDVGKADCILVLAGSSAMLIDAGSAETSSEVVGYLHSHGVQRLNYIIATHSHLDHIGGMASVLDKVQIDKFLIPDIPDSGVEYQSLLQTLSNKKIEQLSPSVGEKYQLGNAEFTILAPSSTKYKNLNNYSIVIRLSYGNTSFLFTGDAMTVSEKEILANKPDLTSTVLKVAHHGGSGASSLDFLKAVNPKYAVLSVGSDKKGYPSKKILQRLASLDIAIYRTDEAGTIIATSDGNNVVFDKEPSLITPSPTKTPKAGIGK
jgi:competence protein ComEC